MKFSVKQGSLTDQPCDALVVNLFEGVKSPGGGTGAVDKALGGAITRVIAEEEFQGALGSTTVIRACDAIPAKKIVLVGLGKAEDFGVIEIMRASGAAGRTCRNLRARSVASILHGAGIGGMAAFDCAKALILGTMLGTYQHIRLKTEDVKDNSIESFEIVELSPAKLDEIERGIRRAEVIGDAITFARDLANEPSNIVTPSYLSNIAEEIAAGFDMRCVMRDRAGIEEEGMNLLAAVARGSGVEPRFIEIRYESPDAKKTVAIIGKGITFDSGGYSIKTAEGMQDMKGDMAGAAAVLAAMRAVGKLKPGVNVLALIPAAENSIGGRATHPGDVFKSYSGKTVEIVDTDAEGRLTLADAIAYASKAGVDEIVDVATLTGACVIALGKKISGILGTEQGLVDRLIEAGASCGEKLWQLPLDSDYKDQIRSDIADLKNVSGGKGAGPITAALFMEAFTGGVAWAHIDLSASDTDEDTPLAKKGNTGAGTGTLVEYLLGF